MGIAVISAYSSMGTQRLAAAPSNSQQPAATGIDLAVQAAQIAQTAEETRRLSEQMRALTADREQLLTRIASLEHGLDDVTGAIKHVTTQATAPAGQASAPPAQAPMPAAPPNVVSAPVVTPPPRPDVASVPAPPPAPPEAAPVTPPDTSVRMAEAQAEPAGVMPGLGIDVGGAVNFEGLRTLWFSTRHNNPDLPDDIIPVVAVRENSKTRTVDLRLVVGPISSAETAARFCAALLASHHYCQTVAFEGQRLSFAEPAPKPAPAPAHHAPVGP
jgi:hypothetical protein